jgi:hypothetical protein
VKDEDNSPPESQAHRDDGTRERAAEQGDVSEPDAPTAGEENEGMSTILSVDASVGVQKDAGEE